VALNGVIAALKQRKKRKEKIENKKLGLGLKFNQKHKSDAI